MPNCGTLGLLFLHQFDFPAEAPHELTRIFNCLKDQHNDRQIGDRRGRNACEARLQSSSKSLPSGPDFADLLVDTKKHRLSICCTDRRDFYHQFWATPSRAVSNTVVPPISIELFRDLSAMKSFTLASTCSKSSRLVFGDRLGFVEGKSSKS